MVAVSHAQGRIAERALERVRILGISPLERPDAGLVAAVCEAGSLGVLDVGRDPAVARVALATLSRRVPTGFGVRIPDGVTIDALPPEADVVIVGDAAQVEMFPGRAVIVQVRSIDEARAAVAAGARGVIAKGSESGGRIAEETAFVLLQRVIREVTVPVWVQGGIGLHTAAACIAGGATGVVIDSQLALVRESSLGVDVRGAIAAMDGSETTIIAGYRVYTRPDLPVVGMADASVDAIRAKLGGDDLAHCVLPLGQEAAFARPLAARFATAARLVRGLDAAITSHLAQAAATQPLAPGAPLAAAHGMKYPIAQGPMSRVSDRAAFADAVATGGGLPFLALTLMTGGEVRELLRDTQALLGDRPWGVGILGFVPPEIREQQLAVLKEIPPPVALIAGGRPSQASPLEAQGTSTYLHVPSPGLLDLFLRDGARKFVFEGRECGGHVGPRSSFALWEAQIERLLAHPNADELSVLFCGGVHDARSAAMVAAMAAPLAARGAKIGVLMGTAYLFTEEAVAAGAIQPGFQTEAIACESTILLETAPGHSTRCADTAFATAFTEERQRLERTGATPQERWAALEQLNLGRLRIAAKGLRRDGGSLVAVEATAQHADGMYMIGQVAALRRDVVTVAQLHKQVSEDGNVLLETICGREAARGLKRTPARTLDRTNPSAPGARPTDVAVIGLAAIFPGAPDTDAFWTSIVTGKNAVREVPPERWDAATYYDPAATGQELAGKKTPCKWGGFLDEIVFDPLAYGIPPKSLAAIEPVQLLSLEIARRALADAGYADREFPRERCSVIFGAEAGTDLSSAYSFRALFPQYVGPLPQELDATLPTLSEDSFPGVLSNVIAGRIANRLDLGGVNYTVDAACAASLAAVDMAVKELVSGSSDMVLCGGADLHNSINDYLLFSSVHALSPTGQCHTFDADADGIVLGEGVACVVLKRVADAERDGDRIYAVIKGVAGASDGKSLGLTAPRKDGQVRALERAYKQSGVSPAQVGLVEAHGTGTVVGDKTELATLTEVYTKAGAGTAACVLGSVKSQIGHTKCAAGMAGLIKATLAVHHGVLPPTLNIKKPNSAWNREASPFVFLDQARPWPAEDRVAAVSAFGFGGTNFHAVLSSHRGGSRAGDAWPAELVLFRGEDRATAVAAVERLHRLLAKDPALRLRDIARSVCAGGRGPVWIAVVADSIDDLRAKLDGAKAGTPDRRGVYIAKDAGPERGAVAFLCPGQGSQRPGMLADLFIAFPRLHRLLALGAKFARRMYPPASFTREDRAAHAAALTDTRVAQPALGIADLAVAELLQSLGVRPDLAGGHSYGELAALAIAGAIGEADLLALSEARGEHILEAAGADPGSMVAVAADATVVAPVVAGCEGVVIANHNSPSQCVLSGPTAAIEMALVLVGAAGLTARRIPVACAFHSPVVAAARDGLARTLGEMVIDTPRIPVYSNVTAGVYPADPDGVRELVAAQVAQPVKFAQEIEAMYAAGARIFVETGPGQVLTRLVTEILGERPHVAVATDTGGGDPGVRQLLKAVATLAVAGVPVDPSPLFWDRDAVIVELDPDRADKKSPMLWLVNGQLARPVGSQPPPKATPVPVQIIGAAAAATALATTTGAAMVAHQVGGPIAVAPVTERDGVVVEYLRNMRSMITAQRDVMLQYLGANPVVHREPVELAPQLIEIAPIRAEAVEVPGDAPAPIVEKQKPTTLQLAVTIVSERTGYPVETLGLDLDLEADLSIDSIKRIEIIGELAARLGLRVQDGAANGDAVVEELAQRKTLRSLVGWLDEKVGTGAPEASAGPAPSPDPSPTPSPRSDASASPTRFAIGRYVLQEVDAPLPVNGAASLAGKRVGVVGGGEVAAVLAHRLGADGAHVRMVAPGEELVNGHAVDVLVHLGPLTADGDPVGDMRELFARLREAALGGAATILVATAGGVGGPAGMVKTLAAEYPGISARVVDVDPAAPSAELAAVLHAELRVADEFIEIGVKAGARTAKRPVAAPVTANGSLVLDDKSVVLITGGARGITAKVAIELAKRSRCTIALVGRSPEPEVAEDASFAHALDAPALRRTLIERGVTSTSQVEAECARILADREIRATLAAIRDAGSAVSYHAVDVREPELGALIEQLYARHGRIDGVIHGAGVLEDKLIRDKTPESFSRVFATKVAGAHTLAERLRRDVRFVVMFASISGAFGNRGQVDYAAANDALDKLALSLGRRVDGRVVSIDWGPWAGAGMVSPTLAREYARRGIDLIDADRGVEALLAELASDATDGQVILTAADPRALVKEPAAHAAPAMRPDA